MAEAGSLKEFAHIGLMVVAIALSLTAWRWRRAPSLGYALFCLGVAAALGAFVGLCYDQVQSNHGSWGALAPLIALIVAVILGGAFALAGIVELLRVIFRGLST